MTWFWIGLAVAVAGIGFGLGMSWASDVLEDQKAGDQGWSALALLGIFGGLAIAGTGVAALLEGAYMWVFDKSRRGTTTAGSREIARSVIDVAPSSTSAATTMAMRHLAPRVSDALRSPGTGAPRGLSSPRYVTSYARYASTSRRRSITSRQPPSFTS